MNEALLACVDHCGGFRAVGAALWPRKPEDDARRQLRDSLTEGRRETLDPEEVLFVLRLAHDRGYHGGMHYLAATLGYSQPVPVARVDAQAELQRQFVEATQTIAKLAARLDALNEPLPAAPSMRVVS